VAETDSGSFEMAGSSIPDTETSVFTITELATINSKKKKKTMASFQVPFVATNVTIICVKLYARHRYSVCLQQ
jgi:hypothetical protein